MIQIGLPFADPQTGEMSLREIKSYEVTEFPDGTKKFKISPPEILVAENITIIYYYTSPADFFDLISIIDMIKSVHKRCELLLFILYMPYARMDRVEENGESFTLKSYINILNNLPINNLYVFDPHSKVTPLLISDEKRSNVEKMVMEKILQSIISIHLQSIFTKQESFYIAFPDFGSQKRYSSIIKDFGIDERIKGVFLGKKDRDWKSGEVKELEINMITGEWIIDKQDEHNIVIFDDILTTGKTIECFIEKFKEEYNYTEPKFYVYASHMEPHIYKSRLLEENMVEKILTTTSLAYHSDYDSSEREELFKKYKDKINFIDPMDMFFKLQTDAMQRNIQMQQQQMKAMRNMHKNKILTPKDI